MGLGEQYLQKIEELRDILVQLWGLGRVVGTRDQYTQLGVFEGVKLLLPGFWTASLSGKDVHIISDSQALEKVIRHLATTGC